MAPGPHSIKVLREDAGPKTGDRLIVDEHGFKWLVVSYLPIIRVTGDPQGVLRGNEIYET